MAASLLASVSTHLKSVTELIGDTDCSGFDKDYRGWNSHHQIFAALVNEVQPKVYVEVGVWKGLSLLNVAGLTKDLQTTLYACDTWLGGIDHVRSNREVDQVKQDSWGYPMLYHQFLFNMADSGAAGRTYPVVQTSINCARWLKEKGVKADLVYVDASHEGWDPYWDMCHYWELVRERGVMFGDDMGFPGVKQSVEAMAAYIKQEPEIVDGNFWVFRK